jgi:hypothetical protein
MRKDADTILGKIDPRDFGAMMVGHHTGSI